jgi:methyl-accepting chemotaxis protein
MRDANPAKVIMSRFRISVGMKIYSIIGLSFCGLLGLATLQASNLAESLKDQRKSELRHLAEVAHSIAREEHDAAKRNQTTDQQAQTLAAARIAKLRYGKDDYFWINDLQPRMVMHPTKPELNGQDLGQSKDPTGKRLFVEFADVVKSKGAGYVEYQWPKPGKDAPQPKLSFVTGFAPWGWVIGTGVYIDDLQEQIWENSKEVLIAALVVIGVLGSLTILIARKISKALVAMTASVTELGEGNFGIELSGLDRSDELGDMARSIEAFKVKAEQKAREETERKLEQDEYASAQRRQDMHRLADKFESAVGEIVETVTSASVDLESSATQLSATAEQSHELASVVSAASGEASSSVSSVASATGQLTSSVNEIGSRVQESARMAEQAVAQAQKTNNRVLELSKAANRIGDIVELITTIAAHTNLLALNATIEAARAGDSGRGFAVVALEVKALAQQTAQATSEIAQQIGGIQTATQESVGAIRDISSTIERLAEISSSIASAVEEQGAATSDISCNVQLAAQRTQQVSVNIEEVQRGASDTGAASALVLASAKSLAGDSNRLKLEVSKFLSQVRAA